MYIQNCNKNIQNWNKIKKMTENFSNDYKLFKMVEIIEMHIEYWFRLIKDICSCETFSNLIKAILKTTLSVCASSLF